jgi:hypothetical protein
MKSSHFFVPNDVKIIDDGGDLSLSEMVRE